ncbi:MAG TPA: sigma-70 family RNA polymerase sigma factor [Terriglobales bacterium]|nr:sigma-70 family RNA polymerase sigma factor [Terriglobales bacterium]
MDAPTQLAAALPGLESTVAELYLKSRAVEFALSSQQFTAILIEISAKYLPGAAAPEIRTLYLGLRVEELALARACAAGNERAWEAFLIRYREKLYEVAGYIAKETSAARELADSLYADLYGTSLRDGNRVSKLSSYTGRGSLEGWLRTVMAQEYVNRYRRTRRFVSLEEESEEGTQFPSPQPEPVFPVDARVETAVDRTLSALAPEDRYVLAAYFLDDRTLADIARSLRVHESTISRKLDKLCKSLRKNVLSNLRGLGMSRRQAEEALDVDVRDLRLDLRKRLQDCSPQTFQEKKVGVDESG